MSKNYYQHLKGALSDIEAAGLYKRERLITTSQSSGITVAANGGAQDVVNFCANNYLGLANNPDII